MSLKVKYDYHCNYCGKLAENVLEEPLDWIHGSLTSYPEEMRDNPNTDHDVHFCSWNCVSTFAANQFKMQPSVRGKSLVVFVRDKKKEP
jgi:hypothetical protein